MFNLKNNKGVVNVTAVIMLLAISTIFFFNYYSFQDTQLDDFSMKNQVSDFKRDIEIVKVDADMISIQNDFLDNFFITSIKIDDIECLSADVNLVLGLNEVNIGTCTNTLSLMTSYEVVLMSSYGIKEEFEILYSLG